MTDNGGGQIRTAEKGARKGREVKARDHEQVSLWVIKEGSNTKRG